MLGISLSVGALGVLIGWDTLDDVRGIVFVAVFVLVAGGISAWAVSALLRRESLRIEADGACVYRKWWWFRPGYGERFEFTRDSVTDVRCREPDRDAAIDVGSRVLP